MKYTPRSKKSFLFKTVLASTVFCLFPAASYAVLTPVIASTDTATTPDTGNGAGGVGGYDITKDAVTLKVTDGYIIGATAGTSVDNNQPGAPGTIDAILEFVNNSTVQGQIGVTNPIQSILFDGAGTVNFEGTVSLTGTANFQADGTATIADGADFKGGIDTISAGKGSVIFEGSSSVTGSLGSTNALKQIVINADGNASETVTFSGLVVKANSIDIQDDETTSATGTTLILNNAAMELTAPITVLTDNEDLLDIQNAKTLTGNIGDADTWFNRVNVAANGDTTINGDIFTYELLFKADNKLTLGDGSDVTGDINAAAGSTGVLNLLGTHVISDDGNIGNSGGFSLREINIQGAAGKSVTIAGTTVNVDDINFINNSTATTSLNFTNAAKTTITGNITNTLAANAGIVNFSGPAEVMGTVGGTTNSIVAVNVNGNGSTVLFDEGIKALNTNISQNGTVQIADGKTVEGNVDNTSGTDFKGTLDFVGSGVVTGTIGATRPLSLVRFNSGGAGGETLELQGTILRASTFNIVAGGANTLKLNSATGTALTGNITTANNATDTLDINTTGATTIVGNIGAATPNSFLKVMVGANGNTTVTGNIFATTTEFQADNTLFMNSPGIITGAVTTAGGAGTGILQFNGNGGVTGNIGAGGAELNRVNLAGVAGTVVSLDGDVFTANGINFVAPAQASTTLNIADGKNVTGSIGTYADGIGTVQFQGTSTVSSTIGAAGKSLNAINLLGDGTDSVTFQANVFALTTSFFDDSKLILADTVVLTGAVDNKSGTDGQGTIEFQDGGQITGSIGATRPIGLMSLNTNGAAAKTIELNGPIINVDTINFAGVGKATTLLLNSAGVMNITAKNGLTTVNGGGSLDIVDIANKGLTVFTGNIGAAADDFALVKVGQFANTTMDGDIFATKTEFQGDNTLLMLDGRNITGNVDSTANNQGILSFFGTSFVNGTIGATNPLNEVNILGGAGKAVTFKGDVAATDINFKADGTIIAENKVDFTGDINNATGTAGMGTLTFESNGSVTGKIGSTNALKLINLNGAFGDVVTLIGDTKAQTILFDQDSTLDIGDGAGIFTITGNIDSDAPNQGILEFLGADITVNGTIGATNPLNLVNFKGGIINLNGNASASKFDFIGNETLNVGNNVLITGPITTQNNSQGTVNYLGNSTINQQIGNGNDLGAVNIKGAGSTVVLNTDIFAADTNVTNGATLSVNGARDISGNLTVDASRLTLSPSTTPLGVGGVFDIKNGSTLTIGLLPNGQAASIEAVGLAKLDASTSIVINNASATVAPGSYKQAIVTGADGSDAFLTAVNVSDPFLLLDFETEVVADYPALGVDSLVLNIISLPSSAFADRPNTIGVAGALDTLLGTDAPGTLGQVVDQLVTFTDAETLNKELAALAPIVDNGVTESSFRYMELAFGAVDERLRLRHHGQQMHLGKVKLNSGFSAGDIDDCGRGGWVKLIGEYADQDARDRVDGYKNNTWGLSGGLDMILPNEHLVGVAASWATMHINHRVSDSTTHSNNFQVALYGQHDFCDYWYVNWMGAGGYNAYSQRRHFYFGNLYLEPRGHFHGWQLGAKGELGYEYINGGYHIIPFMSLYYSWLDLSGFTESNVDTAGQVVDSQDYSMLQGAAGLRVAYNFVYSNANLQMVVLQPEIHAQVLHDFVNDHMQTTSQFLGAGPSFVTTGFTPASTAFNIGGGLTTYGTYSDLIFTITYDLHVKEDYVANSGFVRARYEW